MRPAEKTRRNPELRPSKTGQASLLSRLPLAALLLWSFALRLLFALPGLGADRFWDERYSLDNVRALLESGHWLPANGWYTSLSYLPQTALLGLVQRLSELLGRPQLAVLEGGEPTTLAYLLCRGTSALFGVLGVFLTWYLGKRLFGPGVGLLGAFLLAVTPAHLRLSAVFKPDALLVALLLLTVVVGLEAESSRRFTRFAWGGLTWGLALSTKLNAGAALVPLAVAAFGGRRRGEGWRGGLLRLGVAGTAATATFMLLNPHLSLHLEHLARNRRIYAEQAHGLGTGHLEVLWHEVTALVSPGFHGPWVGAAALMGCALLLVRALRGGSTGGPTKASALATAGSFPLGYSLLYALSTPYPKENNFLPIAPFTALAAAWFLARLGAALTARLSSATSPRTARFALVLAASLAVGTLAAGSTRYTLETVIPTTASQAGEMLAQRLEDLPLRLVGSEVPLEVRSFKDRAAMAHIPALHRFAATILDRADAEVFPLSRLEGPERAFYEERLTQHAAVHGEGAFRLEPAWPRRRGPGLQLLLHPWQPARPALALPTTPRAPASAGSAFSTHLPEAVAPGEIISFLVWLPRGKLTPLLRLGETTIPLFSTRPEGRADRFLSPRAEAPAGSGRELTLELPAGHLGAGALEEPPVLEVHIWRPVPGTP